MAAGVLQDAAGNEYGGLSGSEYYFDVTDHSAPIAAVANPAHASTGVNKSSAIVLTFSEDIKVCLRFVETCSALWLSWIVNDKWWSGRLVQATLC